MQPKIPIVIFKPPLPAVLNGAASTDASGALVVNTVLPSSDSQQLAQVRALRDRYMNALPRDIADKGPYEKCATGWGDRVFLVQKDVTEIVCARFDGHGLSAIPKEKWYIAWRMLLIACRTKDRPIAEMLVRANCPRICDASIDIYDYKTDLSEVSALYLAVQVRDLEGVQLLATHEPDSWLYGRALSLAFQALSSFTPKPSNDDIKIFKWLVEHCPLTHEFLYQLMGIIAHKFYSLPESGRIQLLELVLKRIVEILRKNDLVLNIRDVCQQFQGISFDWARSDEEKLFLNRLMINLCLLQTDFGKELDPRLIDSLCRQFRGKFHGTESELDTGNLSDLVYALAERLLGRPYQRGFESTTLGQLDKPMSHSSSTSGEPLCTESQLRDLGARLTAANAARKQLTARLKFNNEPITETDKQLDFVKASIGFHLSQTAEGRAISETQISQYAELALISINPTGAPIVNSMETFYRIGESLAAMAYRDLTEFESRLPTLVAELTPASFPGWLKTQLAFACSTCDLVQLEQIKAARVVSDETYAVGLIKKQLEPQVQLVVNTATSIN